MPAIQELLASRYGQEIEDVMEWLELTHWSQEQLSEKSLKKVQNQLLKLGLTDKKLPSDQILYNL